MKEKIKRFVENGGLNLIGGFVALGWMLYLIVGNALDKDMTGCIASAYLFCPWILLFFSLYEFQKRERNLVRVIKRFARINEELSKGLKYYQEYSKEEIKQESHDTDK